jgi:hypothetical protein
MIEYKYKKKENKFTENGNTMFEEDVLQRLKRLADLEEQINQGQSLPIDNVSKSLNATYKKGDNVILDTGLKAEILGFKNNLAIVLDERGLKFYKQLHKIKHQ